MPNERRRVARSGARELISEISHELRTPLSALHGLSEILLQGDLPRSKQVELLRVVHDETLRLRQLVGDLLELARLENGLTELEIAPFDLAEELPAAVARLAAADSAHRAELDANGLPTVGADVGQLRRALDELLDNAARFSAAGGTIAIRAEVAGDEVVIEVADTGLGIPETSIDKIFERFYRVNTPEHQEHNGNGLGLAFVRGILEAHGGAVRVESVLGEGSRFEMRVPLQRKADERGQSR